MEKDYFVPFADYGEDKFEEKRSKFTGRLWHVETAEEAVAKIKAQADAVVEALAGGGGNNKCLTQSKA